MRRFDPASLAILERFDRLESLLFSSGKASLLDHQTSPGTVTVSSPSQREIGSRLGCVQSSLINVRLEAVLQWQPIRVLVNSVVPPTKMVCTPVAFHQQAGSLSDEFIMSTCNALLENFWRGVHSKNPILNKDEVKRFMHQVCLDGISWDAQSCLVVRGYYKQSLMINANIFQASSLCSRHTGNRIWASFTWSSRRARSQGK